MPNGTFIAGVIDGGIIAGTPQDLALAVGGVNKLVINGVTGASTALSAINLATGAAIASAATINLDTATGNRVHITGTVAITAVTLTNGSRTVIFDGILTLTHSDTTNNLPNAGLNIITAAGDRAVYETSGGVVRCTSYVRANGQAITPTLISTTAPAGTNTTQVATTAGVMVQIPSSLNAAGSAPMYACRAWVNFNGTGTVAIRSSGNVSSITDNGVGDYTVNFTTAMQDANYAVSGIGTGGTSNDNSLNLLVKASSRGGAPVNQTASGIQFSFGGGTSAFDGNFITVSIFR